MVNQKYTALASFLNCSDVQRFPELPKTSTKLNNNISLNRNIIYYRSHYRGLSPVCRILRRYFIFASFFNLVNLFGSSLIILILLKLS